MAMHYEKQGHDEELPPVEAERWKVVDRANRHWIERLVDLSRRNSLLYYKSLKQGTLELDVDDFETVAALIRGELLPIGRLARRSRTPRSQSVRPLDVAQPVPTSSPIEVASPLRREAMTDASAPTGGVANDDATILADLARRLREIDRRARLNREERGVETLFLALGMATWTSHDGGSPPRAPVLLYPLAVEPKGDGQQAGLRVVGELEVNPTLLHVLSSQYGCPVDAEALLMPVVTADTADTAEPTEAFARLQQICEAVPGFAIAPAAVIGNFSYQKLAMVRDLSEQTEAMAAHDVIAALAGDSAGRQAVRGRRRQADPRSFDYVPPENEFLILDADASQQQVVDAALNLQSGVIQGPPGTGKSQTIANLIAALVASGHRVLFVAEKRAALEVVLRRLESSGLGHLALDLHGADISRRALLGQIAQSLSHIRNVPRVDADTLHKRFGERRARLVGHVNRMHAPTQPSGLSVYQLQGLLLQLPVDARGTMRWRGAALAALDSTTADDIRALLEQAAGFEGFFWRSDPSRWTGAALPTGESAQEAVDLASRLAHHRWPSLVGLLASITAQLGSVAPATVAEVGDLARVLDSVGETLSRYDAALFQQDLAHLIAALTPGTAGGAGALLAGLFNSDFRKARRTLKDLRHAGPVGPAQLRQEAEEAATQLAGWRRWMPLGTQPTALGDVAALSEAVAGLNEDWRALGHFVRLPELAQLSLAEAQTWASALAADTIAPHRLPRLTQIEDELTRRGLAPLLADLRATRAGPRQAVRRFDHAYWTSCLDHARTQDPLLAGFSGQVHDGLVEDFQELDRTRLALASRRVERAHAEQVVAAMNAYPEQEALVRREAQKRMRHLPLRTLLRLAPDVLPALRPCWMASPLSVSQLLPADRRYFDVVIFDEASQVLPEDAVPAILRADHAVVAGDSKQLPPTTFFAGGEDEEDGEAGSATAGFESLLSSMAAFLDAWWLNWHYRSRDEALIAFSNRHIYEDRLVSFPGATDEPALEHILVEQDQLRDGEEQSVGAEVRRVVALILDHAARRPDQTLGVIAMGLTHANRVQAALDLALPNRPDLEAFFDPTREERFFIKNLERVQGDERDAIILTIGYGKDRNGRLPYRFGPLLTEGGERRLNVAITRARQRMTLVSAFTHLDMDPNRSAARGAELLRLYLQYVISQGVNLTDGARPNVAMNAFEQNVYAALTARGVLLVPQWGAAQYRIDFAVQHPERPGRMVLAIECDGASYHASATARERDRLRQGQLERLGWTFHRIWSTDWFNDRDREIERAVSAVTGAIARADAAEPDKPLEIVALPSAVRADHANGHPGAAAVAGERVRAPRPLIPRGYPITEYSQMELVGLIRWIESDGRLRTDEELTAALAAELGFRRRGRRIEAAIGAAIQAAHRSERTA